MIRNCGKKFIGFRGPCELSSSINNFYKYRGQSTNFHTSKQPATHQTYTNINSVNRQLIASQTSILQLNSALPANSIHIRYYSTTENNENDDGPKRPPVPRISDEPIDFAVDLSFLWRNLFVWFKENEIRYKYDPEFSVSEFIEGSKTAIEVCKFSP